MRHGFKACLLPVAILLAWLSAIGSAWAADPQARALTPPSPSPARSACRARVPRIIEAGLTET
jgi:hypothetical protein